MSRQLPHLAMDGVLCDRPQEGCVVGKFIYARDNRSNSRKEKTMSNFMTDQQVQAHAKKLVAKLLGQDAAMDDESAARIKEFLKGKLSAADHETLCSMLDGDGEAQGDLASDAKADFHRRYPEAARIRIDNSGIPLSKRAARTSDADMKSFYERYPDAARIKML